MRLILWTCQVEIEGLDKYLEIVKQHPTIVMVWHSRLAMIISILQKTASQFRYAAVISQSRDGKLIADLVDSYPQSRAIRVAGRARHQGLRETVRALQNGEIVYITPDGPRGPSQKIKPGVFFAARAASAQVMALSWESSAYWELSTWDRMRIPKPFSQLKLSFSGPYKLLASDQESADHWENKLRTAEDKLTGSLPGK